MTSITTASGLQIEEIQVGTGDEAQAEESQGTRNANADRIFRLVLDTECLHGQCQERCTWWANAFGKFNQQHKGGHRQCGSKQVIQSGGQHGAARMANYRQQGS